MTRSHRPARASGADGSAVSSIVAAVLLVALFATAFTLWTAAELPEWIADREESHAGSVRESFLQMQAGLDALSASEDAGPTSVTLPLAPRRVPVLQSQPALGSVGIGGDVRLVAAFDDERLLVEDGVARLNPDEPIDAGAGDLVADIVELDALVVFLSTSSVGNDQEAWVEVAADDGDDTVTARIVHAGKLGGSGPNVAGCLNGELRLEVTVDVDPASPSTTTQALLCELADDLTGYTVDLGMRLSSFAQNVERLDTPYTIRLTEGGDGGVATGSYGIAYLGPGGIGSSSGSGEEADIDLDEAGPRLSFDPRYNEFEGPAAAWELGALVLEQGDGAAVDTAAGFHLIVQDGVGQMDWTIVMLEGSGGRAGDGAAAVRVSHEATYDIVLTAEGATFTLTSEAAAAWRAFFADRILLADAAGAVAVGGSGTTATLALATGPGAVDEWIVHLRLVHATLVVS